MKARKFPNWHPVVGDKAVVPGGPACRRYIDNLTAEDCQAIENGHTGYSPIELHAIATSDKWTGATRYDKGEILDSFVYFESAGIRRRTGWYNGFQFVAKDLNALKRAINSYHGKGTATLDVKP